MSTIGAIDEVHLDYPIMESFAMGKGFVVLSGNGIVEFFNHEGKKISNNEIGANIVATDSIGGRLLVASSSGEISLLSENSEKVIISGVGCESISLSGQSILLSTEDGDLLMFDKDGSKKASIHLPGVTIMRFSENHNEIVIASEDGKMTILSHDLELLGSSPPAEDDIEVITYVSAIKEGRFLVSRESLGAVVDDRPVNRVEFWDLEGGLLEVVEIPSRATSILASGDGYYVGCFEGELLWIESEKDPYLLSNLGYSVTDLIICNEDVIASSWFYAKRVSPEGVEKWIFEHPTIISKILNLDEGIIALVSGNGKYEGGSRISLIDPNKEASDSESSFQMPLQTRDLSDSSFSGMPTENEISIASKRNTVNEIDSIIRDINESLEISMTELNEEEDILEALASSAAILNLPPVADAGDDVTIISNTDSKADVILDGSKSYDPDGEIVSWSWISENGRVLGESPIIKVRLSQGVHSFSLSVTDNKGATSASKMTVRVV